MKNNLEYQLMNGHLDKLYDLKLISYDQKEEIKNGMLARISSNVQKGCGTK